jgi:spermidine dehydrogenase
MQGDGVTRRDFLNGVALSLSLPLALPAAAQEGAAAGSGFSGQTDELLAPAHTLRDDPARVLGTAAERDEGVEDLLVIGAGISGLAGAWLFREHAGRTVRMLVLDALDQIGGHAHRNEFLSRSGRRMVGYGGSQSLDTPGLFSPATRSLLAGVGIDLDRFKSTHHDSGWAERQGLVNRGHYFGEGRLVLHAPGEKAEAWLARTPLGREAQQCLARLFAGQPLRTIDPGLTRAQRRARLARVSYAAWLREHWQATAEVLAWLQHSTEGYFGVGIDATTALDAWANGSPGFGSLDLGDQADPLHSPTGRQLMAGKDDYIYHFPDGNHGVARALLRALIPSALPGQGMETLSSAVLDATELDREDRPVRVRLKATAVQLRHLGPPGQAERVEVRYVDAAGRVRLVRAKQVLLACWHRVIARLTDELPPAQVHALQDQVKVPLLYGTVLVSNWQPWKAAGLSRIAHVGGFWDQVELDFPVSMGAIRFPQDPSEPMLLHLGKVVVPGDGRSARKQAAAGRAQLMQWPFAKLEAETRALLQGALGPHGFDAARDIEAIVMNRWAHGYAYEYMRPWDRYWPQGPLPVETARRGWGRVAIANADSGAYADAHGAIDQATRAVAELLPQARLPAWHPVPGPNPKDIGLA